jgi:hypothetical protein
MCMFGRSHIENVTRWEKMTDTIVFLGEPAVRLCYQLVATRRPKAVLDVEFDEQFESEVRMTLASMVQEIYASLGRCLTGWRTFR